MSWTYWRAQPALWRAAWAATAVVLSLGLPAELAHATESKNLAPGFSQLGRSEPVVVLPIDVELFSISAGGVPEPKADWTATAAGHMKQALHAKIGKLRMNAQWADDALADEFAEQVGLHAAVARSIALHHFVAGGWALPSKEGKLDWSFDDSMRGIQAKTGARYGLFVWVRDSYASAERKAAMVLMALVGVGLGGGVQNGYASLVDLESGRVLWFNRLARASGDMREAGPAAESIDALMIGFPVVQ